ncbi:cytotoxic and regulatory T-cell molecule [Ammospiza nelsoni]|uniref:cytotoxic and regulatory T-cell molecule n=1 Tax=Ammospiza nelsoni TaxID=2857394 RepID=UPI00286C4078|nr:cytotoxic and regulatory T-cell molecule [Ammospiza nelsoni]
MSVPGALLAVPLLLLQGAFAGADGDSVALKEGENLNLNCTFSTLSNHNFTLQWLNPRNFTIFLNAQQVLRDRRYKLLRYSRDELSIQLSNLTLQDEGIYRCLRYARHVRAQRQNVQILAPPSQPVLEISQDEERGIKLSCHTQGSRPQPRISWLLDNGIELPGDTRHELGADGSSWSSRSTLRVLSCSPAGTATASCAIGHPALGARTLLAPFAFQNLPSPGCKQASRPSEDAEVPSSSENPAVPSSPENAAVSSPSASPKEPGVSSPSASPENPETSSPSASPKDPEVPSPSASPENTEFSSSPSASPNDPGVLSPSASQKNPGVSSPSASPENTEFSSPSASPKDPKVSIPSASPNDPGVSKSSASPENPETSTPSASPRSPELSSPSASPKDPEVSSPSASPGIPAVPAHTFNSTNLCDFTEQNPESKGLLRKEKNLLLPMLVAALVLVLLIIVLLFMVKLKKAHGAWRRENDASEQTLESYKSRSNEESPGHEKNGQAGNPKSNMQYVTEEHVETPEKNLETAEKNPECPEKNPGDKIAAINEEIFASGRETDV